MFDSKVGSGAAAQTYRHSLIDAISEFLSPLVKDDGWSPWNMVVTAVLMALGSGETLVDRFYSARSVLVDALPRRRRIGKTIQGFNKALVRMAGTVLPDVRRHLREQVRATAGEHWERFGWPIFTVDGSKIDCVRSKANEKHFGIGGKERSGPQQLLTVLLHMGSGLAWDWEAGRANDSERDHLRKMIRLLPEGSLLVADAGFVSYELMWRLQNAGIFFLIRAGANITLLRKLGFEPEQRKDVVYLWPNKRRKEKPLILRLIRVQQPGKKNCMCLLTNVFDEERLCDDTAAAIYGMRWGVEVFYRSLKQTLQRRKMLSAAPRQAFLELHWTLVAMLLMSLLSVREMMARGRDPLGLSVASARRVIQRAMHKPPNALKTLLTKLASAVKDKYKRTNSCKKSRDWPDKKKQRPPGEPKMRDATPGEVLKAQQLMAN